MCHRQKICTMIIPYRIRRGFQRFLVTICVLAVICITALAAWMLWLNRYVIYTDDGAKLDFGLSFDPSGGIIAQPPEAMPDVSISYGSTDDLLDPPSTELKQMEGYVVTTDMLTGDTLAKTRSALDALPAGSTVLLEVKNLRGEFYYTTLLGRNPEQVDVSAVMELIRDLQDKGCYLIARIPAFRDRYYFLDDEMTRVPYGLPLKGGNGSLWEDRSVSGSVLYWFNPASTGTQNFLVQIVTELRTLGFDEVVFSDFRFPETSQITFSGDKAEALAQAAQTLVQACSTDTFAVSFTGDHFALPQGRFRVYLENVAAADIISVVNSLTLENPSAQLVFLTDLLDTRYESYSVLRPLELPD